MDKKAENKTESKLDKNSTQGTSTNKKAENNMNRTEFAQEYNLNTDKQSNNCSANKANKNGNKNSGQK